MGARGGRARPRLGPDAPAPQRDRGGERRAARRARGGDHRAARDRRHDGALGLEPAPRLLGRAAPVEHGPHGGGDPGRPAVRHALRRRPRGAVAAGRGDRRDGARQHGAGRARRGPLQPARGAARGRPGPARLAGRGGPLRLHPRRRHAADARQPHRARRHLGRRGRADGPAVLARARLGRRRLPRRGRWHLLRQGRCLHRHRARLRRGARRVRLPPARPCLGGAAGARRARGGGADSGQRHARVPRHGDGARARVPGPAVALRRVVVADALAPARPAGEGGGRQHLRRRGRRRAARHGRLHGAGRGQPGPVRPRLLRLRAAPRAGGDHPCCPRDEPGRDRRAAGAGPVRQRGPVDGGRGYLRPARAGHRPHGRPHLRGVDQPRPLRRHLDARRLQGRRAAGRPGLRAVAARRRRASPGHARRLGRAGRDHRRRPGRAGRVDARGRRRQPLHRPDARRGERGRGGDGCRPCRPRPLLRAAPAARPQHGAIQRPRPVPGPNGRGAAVVRRALHRRHRGRARRPHRRRAGRARAPTQPRRGLRRGGRRQLRLRRERRAAAPQPDRFRRAPRRAGPGRRVRLHPRVGRARAARQPLRAQRHRCLAHRAARRGDLRLAADAGRLLRPLGRHRPQPRRRHLPADGGRGGRRDGLVQFPPARPRRRHAPDAGRRRRAGGSGAGARHAPLLRRGGGGRSPRARPRRLPERRGPACARLRPGRPARGGPRVVGLARRRRAAPDRPARGHLRDRGRGRAGRRPARPGHPVRRARRGRRAPQRAGRDGHRRHRAARPGAAPRVHAGGAAPRRVRRALRHAGAALVALPRRRARAARGRPVLAILRLGVVLRQPGAAARRRHLHGGGGFGRRRAAELRLPPARHRRHADAARAGRDGQRDARNRARDPRLRLRRDGVPARDVRPPDAVRRLPVRADRRPRRRAAVPRRLRRQRPGHPARGGALHAPRRGAAPGHRSDQSVLVGARRRRPGRRGHRAGLRRGRVGARLCDAELRRARRLGVGRGRRARQRAAPGGGGSVPTQRRRLQRGRARGPARRGGAGVRPARDAGRHAARQRGARGLDAGRAVRPRWPDARVRGHLRPAERGRRAGGDAGPRGVADPGQLGRASGCEPGAERLGRRRLHFRLQPPAPPRRARAGRGDAHRHGAARRRLDHGGDAAGVPRRP